MGLSPLFGRPVALWPLALRVPRYLDIIFEIVPNARQQSIVLSAVKIDFEWLRFTRYESEVREASPAPRGPRTAAEPLKGFPQSIYIRVSGDGPTLRTLPLEKFPNLYLELEDYDSSLESHLNFARKYGLLTNKKEESLYDWEQRLGDLKKLVRLGANQENWKIANGTYIKNELPNSYNLRFSPNSIGQFDFTIAPRNLYSAIYLQCVSSLATGSEIRTCRACGKSFQIGGGTGQRSNRRFCSNKCRFSFNHRDRRGKS